MFHVIIHTVRSRFSGNSRFNEQLSVPLFTHGPSRGPQSKVSTVLLSFRPLRSCETKKTHYWSQTAENDLIRSHSKGPACIPRLIAIVGNRNQPNHDCGEINNRRGTEKLFLPNWKSQKIRNERREQLRNWINFVCGDRELPFVYENLLNLLMLYFSRLHYKRLEIFFPSFLEILSRKRHFLTPTSKSAFLPPCPSWRHKQTLLLLVLPISDSPPPVND